MNRGIWKITPPPRATLNTAPEKLPFQKDGSLPTILFQGPIFDDDDDKLDKNKNKVNKIKDNKLSVTWHYYRETRCPEPG